MKLIAKDEQQECYYVVTRSRGRKPDVETIFEDLTLAMEYVEERRKQESWFTVDLWPATHTIGSFWCIEGIVKR